MTVIARDSSATDHLVYAWPLPIGPECEVACSEEEQVVMCPAWMVGDRLGPGRHRWRTPDPTRPVSAYFVLTAPVDVSFDMVTGFVIPQSGQPVRLRATGSLQVRCADPGLLIAQFVGLPFDMVNDGILRSVRRSVERMLARLLTRRVVMAGTPAAVTDSAAVQQIVEELVAYNPTAGAVFGVELIRMGYVAIGADNGTGGPLEIPAAPTNGANGHASHPGIREKPTDRAPAQVPLAAAPPEAEPAPPGSPNKFKRPPTPRLDQQPGMSPSQLASQSATGAKEFTTTAQDGLANKKGDFSIKDGATVRGVAPFGAKPGDGEQSTPPAPTNRPPTAPPAEVRSSSQGAQTSGEIGAKSRPSESAVTSGEIRSGEIRSGEIKSKTPPRSTLESPSVPPPNPSPRRAAPMTVPSTDDEVTEPAPSPPEAPPAGAAGKAESVPQLPRVPTMRGAAPLSAEAAVAVAASAAKAGSGNTASPTKAPEPPRSVLGIGMGAIGVEPPKEAAASKVPVGGRVLVPGPNGLMQSATVRQLLQGYYEIEIGSTGQTVWVPVAGVVPD
ncbi:MAG TPA: hypothetical protein VGM90_00730 [Kofleriaceae bacterium]|jgi:hypothetical protein